MTAQWPRQRRLPSLRQVVAGFVVALADAIGESASGSGLMAQAFASVSALAEAGTLCAAARAANADEATSTTAAPPAPPFDVMVFVRPKAALRVACGRLDSGAFAESDAKTVDGLLDVAEAALWSGQVNPAERVLDALASTIQAGRDDSTDADARARFHLLRAYVAQERSEMPRMGVELELARATLETAGLTRTRRFADVLTGLATVRRHSRAGGGLQQATEALDQATALLQALGLDVSIAMIGVLNERTVLANARQDLPGAVAAARQEIAMYRQLGHGDSPALLDAQTSLSGLLATLGRLDEAEVEFEEGLRLIDLHPDEHPSAALGLLCNLASQYSDDGRLAMALSVGDRAVAYAVRIYGNGSVRSVRPLSVRANTLRRMARYAESRRDFEQALRIATDQPAAVGPLRRLNLYDSLTTTLTLLGEVAEARDVIGRGLQETGTAADLGYWRGRLLLLRGTLSARAGDWAAADADTAQGMALIGPVVGERNPYLLGMWSQRCYVQTNGSLPGGACAEVVAALDELNGVHPGYRFRAMAVLANDDEKRGRHDQALLHHLQAVAAAESVATPDPLWSAYAALAEHLRARGLKPMAILMGKQAVEQIERMRASLGADAQRFERGFLSDKLGVYRRLADWLTADGRVDEALDVLRLLKEEEFLDFVNRDGGLLGKAGVGPAYSDPEDALRRSWRSDAAGARQPAADNAAEAAATLRREAAFVARWRELLDRLASTPAVPELAPGRAVHAPGQRRVAPPTGELWVWLYPGERRVNLVIDAPTRRTVTALDAAPAEVASAVTRLLAAMERREPVQAQLQSLHALIGVPVERAAAAADGTRRIVFMVDGPLRYLPFAALHDGRRYLGDRYAVDHRVPLPSTAESSTAGRRGESRIVAMGVTRSLAGMSPLTRVAHEICGIVDGPVQGLARDDAACGADGAGRGVMRGSGWMNDAFTEERLRLQVAAAREAMAASRRASILHIGTHFVLRPGRMTRSWLLLGDGAQLNLEALGRLDFSGQVLVTLSACETGLGGAHASGGSGEEIDGLSGLMLRRGAGAVVASLWRVEDASTSVLMQAFYRQLAAGVGPAEALRAAQSDVRSAGGRMAHPFHWAGFYLVTGMY